MRVVTLGSLASPPSSVAVNNVLGGKSGGWGQVLAATGLRALLIAPGVALGGARGGRLILGSLVGSLGITTALFLWYGLQKPAAVALGAPGNNGGNGGGGGQPGQVPGNPGGPAFQLPAATNVPAIVEAQGRTIRK